MVSYILPEKSTRLHCLLILIFLELSVFSHFCSSFPFGAQLFQVFESCIRCSSFLHSGHWTPVSSVAVSSPSACPALPSTLGYLIGRFVCCCPCFGSLSIYSTHISGNSHEAKQFYLCLDHSLP